MEEISSLRGELRGEIAELRQKVDALTPATKKEKLCQFCKKPFQPSRRGQKFCGMTCYYKHRTDSAAKIYGDRNTNIEEMVAVIEGDGFREFYDWLNENGIQDMDFDSWSQKEQLIQFKKWKLEKKQKEQDGD